MTTRAIMLTIPVPGAIVLIAQFVANRQPVRLSIDPFNEFDPTAVTDLPASDSSNAA